MSQAVFRTISVRELLADQLLDLSKKMKLSLSKADMLVVQQIFNDEGRDPTDVELEVIAQMNGDFLRAVFKKREEVAGGGALGSVHQIAAVEVVVPEIDHDFIELPLAHHGARHSAARDFTQELE